MIMKHYQERSEIVIQRYEPGADEWWDVNTLMIYERPGTAIDNARFRACQSSFRFRAITRTTSYVVDFDSIEDSCNEL
jgi:hypothetical protein